MADVSDVGEALKTLIEGMVYPNGTGADPVGSDAPVKIYRGSPDPVTLSADLKPVGSPAKPSARHISIFNIPVERDTTRYPAEWVEGAAPDTTYAASITGNAVTISGAPPVDFMPQNIAVAVGRKAYVYTTAGTETPTAIAAALAALILVDVPGTVASLGTITIPPLYKLVFARVGSVGSATREIQRQEKGFQVTIWTENDAARVALAKIVQPGIANTPRLTLADGSIARIAPRSNTDTDRSQRQGAYRRDLVYAIEYATTVEVVAPQIVALDTELKDPSGVVIAETVE